MIKTHSMLGAEILQKLENFGEEPLLQTAYEIARWHHERWNGEGYPDGLKGEDIPIAAQVVSLADAYDALTSKRCYKEALSHEKSLEMIRGGECGSFNPLLLDCLQKSSEQLRTELTRSEWDRGFRQETYRLSEELLHRGRGRRGAACVPLGEGAHLEAGRQSAGALLCAHDEAGGAGAVQAALFQRPDGGVLV